MSRPLPLLFLLACLAGPASGAEWGEPALWQEATFFDALLAARDRQARSESDPAMIAVLKAIASQASQQVANLQQIEAYTKTQKDNLSYAFTQADPAPSLETIGANFETLTKGNDQIRSNLYYLTARCRIASSQALPDPEMYQAALLILGQIQQLQLELNALYLDGVADQRLIAENPWATSKDFRRQTELLMRSIVLIQDSVFAVYNAGYELAMRCK